MAFAIGDNFGDALVHLLDIHRKEVGNLQRQVAQMCTDLNKLKASALLGDVPLPSGPSLAGHAVPCEAERERGIGAEAITVSLAGSPIEDCSCMGHQLHHSGPAVIVEDCDVLSEGRAPQPHRSRPVVPSAQQTYAAADAGASQFPSESEPAGKQQLAQLSPVSASSRSTVCAAEPMQTPDRSSPPPIFGSCSKLAQATEPGSTATCSCMACTYCTFEEAQAREQEQRQEMSVTRKETKRPVDSIRSLWEEPGLVNEALGVLDEAEGYQASAVARRLFRRHYGRVRASKQSSVGAIRCCFRWTKSPQRCLLSQAFFDSICTGMIIFNSVLAGISVDYQGSASSEKFITAAGHFCSAFFAMELVARMYAEGRDYFRSENRKWNVFDALLVLASVVEVVVINMYEPTSIDDTKSVSSILKIVKMFRLVRVFRVFRFFRELSLMALLIGDSMKSLMWALLLLAIIIYVFSIAFTIQAQEYLMAAAQSPSPLSPEEEQLEGSQLGAIHRYFGSLGRTAYILSQSILGGVSWGDVTDALVAMDWFMVPLFLFYILFCVLAVLNIITGVFVDNAFETARMQREFLVQKEMELREKYVSALRMLFMQMDVDDSGTITLEEIAQFFQDDPRVYSYMCALGLDADDLTRLFTLLDDGNCGELGIDPFLTGCLRLKGQARSIDVHYLIMQIRKLSDHTEAWFRHLEKAFRMCSCTSLQRISSSGSGVVQPQTKKIHVATPEDPEPWCIESGSDMVALFDV